jgi:hypothetical protein
MAKASRSAENAITDLEVATKTETAGYEGKVKERHGKAELLLEQPNQDAEMQPEG